MRKIISILFLTFVFICCKQKNTAIVNEIIGDVRVQILSPTLVRIELKGPKGFEDRASFHITNRNNWVGVTSSRSAEHGFELVKTKDFIVKVPRNATSLDSITVTNVANELIWSVPKAGELQNSFFSNNRTWIPHPNDTIHAWAIVDTPRYIPALQTEAWGGGYNIAPAELPNNGWDLDNDTKDVFVFLPQGNARQLRQDFINLTGKTALMPLYGFGSWDSRYYRYKQQEALDKIDKYRSKKIPLDVFVVDTDWRVGASHGYGVNKKLFPNMEQFIAEAHQKNVRVMFNDHPEPQAEGLDSTEVIYRNNGLRELFDKGLDVWWYDRNWRTAIKPPKGINKEVFGMYIYDWITKDYYPNRRPLTMSNIDGITGGHIFQAPNIASHRYNAQWTGDTFNDDTSLEREIEAAVFNGIYIPFAYTSTDIGGHRGNSTLEQYVRWIQYGALSPMFRLHCTKDITRDPWDYPEPAESILRDFVRMRMRLLPVFYTAARKNYDTGTPILKRCDLNYPNYIAAKTNHQYLLGDNILVAPVTKTDRAIVPESWFATSDDTSGLTTEYFSNKNLEGKPAVIQQEKNIDFDCGGRSPFGGMPKDNFSVCWSGKITIKSKEDTQLGIFSDAGCRVYIGNQLVLDTWEVDSKYDFPYYTIPNIYKSGKTYAIKVEYKDTKRDAVCKLLQVRPEAEHRFHELWIPPGKWENAFTGTVVEGPKKHTVEVPLAQMPIYVKRGAIIPLAPNMQHTNEKKWSTITLDIYPEKGINAAANLYEDDGVSNNYKKDGFRNTKVDVISKEKNIEVTIHPADGNYNGALQARTWQLRWHLSKDVIKHINSVSVDETEIDFTVLPQNKQSMPFSVEGSSPNGAVVLVKIPKESVTKETVIKIEME